MARSRYHAIRLLLDLATAIAPRGSRDAPPELEALEGCRETDTKGWLRCQVPAKGLDGVEHRYYHHPSEKPDAPAMLLLHGLFLDGRAYFNLKSLARDYELYAYDYPMIWSGYQGKLEDFRRLLDDFTATLEIDRFVLIGVSFGGMLALNWTAHLPAERVLALILISTRIPGSTQETRREFKEMKRLVKRYAAGRLYWVQQKVESLYLRRFRGEDRKQMKKALKPKSISYYRQVMFALDGHDGLQDVRRIGQPVFFLLGTDDTLIPVEVAKEIEAELPQAQIELIEAGAHVMSYLDGERLSAKIADFLGSLEL